MGSFEESCFLHPWGRITMRKAFSLLGLGMALSLGSAVAADRDVARATMPVPLQVPPPAGPTLAPQPELAIPPAPGGGTLQPVPVPMVSQPVPVAPPIEVYSRVRYKDLDEQHPHAVKTLVSVPHPATGWKKTPLDSTPMVNIVICVPPDSGEPRIKFSSLFKCYEFDFGDYEVDVRLRDGGIEVDYQD